MLYCHNMNQDNIFDPELLEDLLKNLLVTLVIRSAQPDLKCESLVTFRLGSSWPNLAKPTQWIRVSGILGSGLGLSNI